MTTLVAVCVSSLIFFRLIFIDVPIGMFSKASIRISLSRLSLNVANVYSDPIGARCSSSFHFVLFVISKIRRGIALIEIHLLANLLESFVVMVKMK